MAEVVAWDTGSDMDGIVLLLPKTRILNPQHQVTQNEALPGKRVDVI